MYLVTEKKDNISFHFNVLASSALLLYYYLYIIFLIISRKTFDKNIQAPIRDLFVF